MTRRSNPRDEDLFAQLDRLDGDGPTVVSSVRQPAALKKALRVAVGLGLDANANDATVRAVRDRLEAFAQRRALDAHYAAHPAARPSLAEVAQAAAELDGDPLAREPTLIRRAAKETSPYDPGRRLTTSSCTRPASGPGRACEHAAGDGGLGQ